MSREAKIKQQPPLYQMLTSTIGLIKGKAGFVFFGGMMPTLGDLVREYFPDADADLVEIILWEYTAYPCADEQYIRGQLQHLKDVGPEKVAEEIESDLISASEG